MQNAAYEAKVRAERHRDLFSILRNAKTGTGDGRSAVEAAQLRAACATILESTGPSGVGEMDTASLRYWRFNFGGCRNSGKGTRKQDERPFLTATPLNLISNAEHQQVQALLNEGINLAQQGGIAYSEFERGRYNSVARIGLGLRQRQSIDEMIGEDGAVLESGV
jgi:hypothetical protein